MQDSNLFLAILARASAQGVGGGGGEEGGHGGGGAEAQGGAANASADGPESLRHRFLDECLARMCDCVIVCVGGGGGVYVYPLTHTRSLSPSSLS